MCECSVKNLIIGRPSVIFFFFKQKTAYEIRPCDWSSDVCSSDLLGGAGRGEVVRDGPRGAGRDLDEGDIAGVKGGIDIDARDGGATSPCGPGEQREDQDRRDETSNGAQHPHLPLHVRT